MKQEAAEGDGARPHRAAKTLDVNLSALGGKVLPLDFMFYKAGSGICVENEQGQGAYREKRVEVNSVA